ncbi:hypothetical protein JNB11_00775 [Kocuria palustris]|nr:hypothetical protein [Kocuria palustris]
MVKKKLAVSLDQPKIYSIVIGIAGCHQLLPPPSTVQMSATTVSLSLAPDKFGKIDGWLPGNDL